MKSSPMCLHTAGFHCELKTPVHNRLQIGFTLNDLFSNFRDASGLSAVMLKLSIH